jgi:hypothetical protein
MQQPKHCWQKFPDIFPVRPNYSPVMRDNSPVLAATGICRQPIDLLKHFCGRTALLSGKSKKFPVQTGKTGNFAPTNGTHDPGADRGAVRPGAMGCPALRST